MAREGHSVWPAVIKCPAYVQTCRESTDLRCYVGHVNGFKIGLDQPPFTDPPIYCFIGT